MCAWCAWCVYAIQKIDTDIGADFMRLNTVCSYRYEWIFQTSVYCLTVPISEQTPCVGMSCRTDIYIYLLSVNTIISAYTVCKYKYQCKFHAIVYRLKVQISIYTPSMSTDNSAMLSVLCSSMHISMEFHAYQPCYLYCDIRAFMHSAHMHGIPC